MQTPGFLRHLALCELPFIHRVSALSDLFSQESWKSCLTPGPLPPRAFLSRVHLLSALNLHRVRALQKCTGRWTPPPLFLAKYCAAALFPAALSSFHTGGPSPPCMPSNHHCIPTASIPLVRFALLEDPREMLGTAAWVSHEAEVRQLRFDTATLFDRRRSTLELTVALDHLSQPAFLAYRGAQYLIHWETPALTAAVFIATLTLLWGIPPTLPSLACGLCLLSAAIILGLGVAGEEGRRFCSRALARRRAPPSKSMLESMRNFRVNLGVQQGRLIRVNQIVLRLRSLYTWKDPSRTAIFFLGTVFTASVLANIPMRILASAILLFYFTKAFRDPTPGVVGLAWRRFWDGIPLPSHR